MAVQREGPTTRPATEAYALLEQVVASSSPEDPEMTTQLSTMASLRLQRFRKTGRGIELDYAIRLAQRARQVASTQYYHAIAAHMQGEVYRERFDKYGSLNDGFMAIQRYREAAEFGDTSWPVTMSAAFRWGNLALKLPNSARLAAEGMTTAVDALSRVPWRAATAQDHLRMLGTWGAVPGLAAAAWIQAGDYN